MPKISHYNITYFVRYPHPKNVKCIEKTYRNNRICSKITHFLRKMLTSRMNNLRTLKIKTAIFLGHCFYINTGTLRVF